MPVLVALGKLRAVINDDAYACTFQSFGQYRSSLLKHINNQAAAIQLAGRTQALELSMNAPFEMPRAAIAYPPEHPFPLAVRRVSQLERAMQSGVIVQLDGLTTYTAAPHGGMRLDPQGPWVTKLEVMGRARTAHPDGEALAIFTSAMHDRLTKARKQGRSGWEKPSECTVESLAALLVKAVADGDLVSVANYAMMLHQRDADTCALPAALAAHVEEQPQPGDVADREYKLVPKLENADMMMAAYVELDSIGQQVEPHLISAIYQAMVAVAKPPKGI